MGIEDLKSDWNSLGNTTNQKKITNDQIRSILKSKYRVFLIKVFVFEILILFAYLYFTALIIFTFHQLKIHYLEVLSIMAIAIMLVLFITRLKNLIDSYRIRFSNHSYVTAVKKLAKQKIYAQKYYLFNVISSFLLLVILSILTVKIYNEYDLIQNRYFWVIITSCSLLLALFINKWIRNSYAKVVREAEDLLQEIQY